MSEPSTKEYSEAPARASEESFSEEEKTRLLLGPSTRVRASWRKNHLSNLVWLIIGILVLSNIALLVTLIRSRQVHPTKQVSWLPPKVPTTKLFKFETLYGEPLSPEAEKAWDELMPTGRGFVTIKNDTALPDQPGLNQSLPEQHAMISVFHQLHCIYMTREGYYAARAGNVDQVSAAHLMHCWDYLRQTVMCFADTTMEWIPAPPNDKGSTGWGFEHQCHDFDAIAEWAEENRLKTTYGIH